MGLGYIQRNPAIAVYIYILYILDIPYILVALVFGIYIRSGAVRCVVRTSVSLVIENLAIYHFPPTVSRLPLITLHSDWLTDWHKYICIYKLIMKFTWKFKIQPYVSNYICRGTSTFSTKQSQSRAIHVYLHNIMQNEPSIRFLMSSSSASAELYVL